MSNPNRRYTQLSPSEAMAFHQNGTLSVRDAVASATAWLKAGLDDVDIVVLATSNSDHWDDTKRDFRKAMAALGISDLSRQQAEIVRLNHLLKWTRSNPESFIWFSRDLSEHCPDLLSMSDGQTKLITDGQLPKQVHDILLASDEYFELTVSISVTIEALQMAMAQANSRIDMALELIANEYPELVRV